MVCVALPVFLKEATEDSHSLDPEEFFRHAGVGGTFPLSGATMSPFSPRLRVGADACSRVNGHRLSDDKTILGQFPDVLSCTKQAFSINLNSTNNTICNLLSQNNNSSTCKLNIHHYKTPNQ